MTYFVHHDGALRRVCAVRCDAESGTSQNLWQASEDDCRARNSTPTAAKTAEGRACAICKPSPEDAAELWRLWKKFQLRLEEADSSSDESLHAICTYAELGDETGVKERENFLHDIIKEHAQYSRTTRARSGTRIYILNLRKV